MKRALVIEDSPLIAYQLQDHLEACGYSTVDIASTSVEAVGLAEERCPHLIIADEQLEDGSGIEAIRHICRDIAIPVIFAVADPEKVEREIPNALVLQKPFSGAALVTAIKEAEKAPLLVA